MRTRRQASLQAITLETVATTTQAAQHAVRAYRAGGHRLVDAFGARVAGPAARGAERVAPALADAVRRSGNRAGALAVQGIDAVSDRSGALIGAASSGATAQVKRMASLAQGVSNPVLAQGLDTAARLSLPGAQAVLALSERMADLAARLPQGTQPAKAARPASARRRANAGSASTVRAAVQRGAKAAAQVRGAARQAATAKPAGAVNALVKSAKATATVLKAGQTGQPTKTAKVAKVAEAAQKGKVSKVGKAAVPTQAAKAQKVVKVSKAAKAPKAAPVRASAKVKAAGSVANSANVPTNGAGTNGTMNAVSSQA